MIEIIGSTLYQWDSGRSVAITGIDADYAHFANKGDSKAVVQEITDTQANIPDFLLQTGKHLCVYAVKNGITIESKDFFVTKRERPEDYIYEEDQRNYIYGLITDALEATTAANQAAQNILEAKERGDFTGAKGETGAQGPQGEKGEAPDAVLYTAQALSPEHQAQARENIGAAGKEKDYELIDTITLTEDAALNLTKEPDGTPYSFEAVLITGLANVGTPASKFLFCFNNEKTKYSRGEIQDASKQKTAFTTEMWIERGIWRNTSVTGTNTYYGPIKGDNYQRVHNFDPNTSNHKHITQILTDRTLTAGSIVNIYAIRKEV